MGLVVIGLVGFISALASHPANPTADGGGTKARSGRHGQSATGNEAKAGDGGAAFAGNLTINFPDLTAIAEKPTPNIVFAGFDPVPIQPQTETRLSIEDEAFIRVSKPMFAEFVRVRFRNVGRADAERVHAVIIFYDEDGETEAFRVYDGRWVNNHPKKRTLRRLSAAGEHATLDIATKKHGSGHCYGWDFSETQTGGGLPVGTYCVLVRLGVANEGVPYRDYWVTLTNHGVDKGLELVESCAERDAEETSEKDLIRTDLDQVEDLLMRGNQVLAEYGFDRAAMQGYTSPRGGGSGYSVWFTEMANPAIQQFGDDARKRLRQFRSGQNYLGTFEYVGNVLRDTDVKPAMLQTLEGWLRNLQKISDDLRSRLIPEPSTFSV